MNFAKKIEQIHQQNKDSWAGFEGSTEAWVEFYQHHELNSEKSKQAGHDVYDDVDFALMVSKGGKTKVAKKATEQMKRNFPNAWKAYQNRRTLQKTHLSVIGLRPSQIKDLERFDVDCLEMLAAKPVPPHYEPFKNVANLILNLRSENDRQNQRETKECRESGSNQGMGRQRQTIQGNQSKQQRDSSPICANSEKGKNQEKNRLSSLNFNYSVNL